MAGTVTQTMQETESGYGRVATVKLACVGDASDGTIPDTNLSSAIQTKINGWYLDMVICNPGATAPTADSDVYIKDEDGLDLLGGNGVDLLHNTTTKATVPSTDGQAKQQPVRGTLTLDVDNQSVNSATYDVILIFVT
jgi:hypothetical protein